MPNQFTGPTDIASRFWPKVSKTDTCWLWTGAKSPFGYGRFKLTIAQGQYRQGYAHVVSYELTYGTIPDGLFVLHSCDNPSCVRPDHLRLGTLQENSHDMVAKGRQAKGDQIWSRAHPERVPRGDENGRRKYPERYPRGEQHPNTNFTQAQVEQMRRMRAEGMTYQAIGVVFGCGKSTIHRICKRITWK